MKFINDLKQFKHWSNYMKKIFIIDAIRTVICSLIWLSIGVALFVIFGNTGLLIYIILNLWKRWYFDKRETL